MIVGGLGSVRLGLGLGQLDGGAPQGVSQHCTCVGAALGPEGPRWLAPVAAGGSGLAEGSAGTGCRNILVSPHVASLLGGTATGFQEVF